MLMKVYRYELGMENILRVKVSVAMTLKQPIYGIFEGGGAKGAAHIGALKAVEQLDLEFIGLAGASAGAIVATLVASGLTHDEIMDPDCPGHNILSVYDRTPLDIVGRDGWPEIEKFRHLVTHRSGKKFNIFSNINLYYRLLSLLRRLIRHHGILSMEYLEVLVNEILRDRLKKIYAESGVSPEDVPDKIRFRDLDYDNFRKLRPLKIVVTNITKMKLEIFDKTTTPDVIISEAVAASATIPGVFKLAKIKTQEESLYADGGMVANLPTWVFSNEKLVFERSNFGHAPVKIVGFSLIHADTKNGNRSENDPGIYSYVSKVMRSAIFGSQVIAQEFTEDLHVIPLTTEIPVLNFNAEWSEIRRAHQDGYCCAMRYLKNIMVTFPKSLSQEMERMYGVIKEHINKERSDKGCFPLEHLRANLMQRHGAYSLRIIQGHLMDEDADDRMIVDLNSRGAGQAFSSKSIVYVDLSSKPPVGQRFLTKYEQALVRPSLRSIISIPVFETVEEWERPSERRCEPLGVFSIDSDETLDDVYNSDKLKGLLSQETTVLSAFLKGVT